MTTKGALIWDFNQPWSIEEIDIGDPRGGEVKVQLETAGLCHSDHHLLTGDIRVRAFPVLGGHEGARIAEVTHGLMRRTVIVTLSRAKGKDAESWLGLTAKGGTCVVIAMRSFGDNEANCNVATLALLQKRLQRSLFGGGNPQYDIPELFSLYKLGDLNLDADR